MSATLALSPIRFSEDRSAGLLVDGWINGAGPFTFALDTGAGVSLVTSKVVSAARLPVTNSKRPLVGGLTTTPIASHEETHASRLSLGTINNQVPAQPTLAVVTSLPGSLDGILDPTDLFGTLAYSIDIPNHQLLAFDAQSNGLNLKTPPRDGAIVRWVRSGDTDRPFVKLGDGRLALIDTGSSFGLAVNQPGPSGGNHINRVSDLGGGSVAVREVAPTTVSIGELVLRSVPTDLLTGVPADTPLLLGRRALYPFKITFEPVTRLIIFEPALRPR
ncbi:MAG TPA: aspartyl protease family protein [Pyrinomonadaceae bacterium]